MKEIKIIQNDDGTVKIESMSTDGNPVTTEVGSMSEALDQLQSEFGAPQSEGDGDMDMDMDSTSEPVSASKGVTLEENLPVIDKEKKGMRPKKKADWSDYSGV